MTEEQAEVVTGMAAIIVCLITLLVGVIVTSEPRAEYEINLINQDSVEIYSVDNDRLYYCSPDSITYYLEIDNL